MSMRTPARRSGASCAGTADWSSLHLYKVAEETPFARLFPKTLTALEAADVVRVDGRPVELFFSRLKPGTHIPPHFGIANNRLTLHLPLIVPGDCAIRVGNEMHAWREGELFAFDDSFEHEAWNRSSEDRVVLIFESHHPDLSPDERRAIEYAIEARGRWLKERRVPGDMTSNSRCRAMIVIAAALLPAASARAADASDALPRTSAVPGGVVTIADRRARRRPPGRDARRRPRLGAARGRGAGSRSSAFRSTRSPGAGSSSSATAANRSASHSTSPRRPTTSRSSRCAPGQVDLSKRDLERVERREAEDPRGAEDVFGSAAGDAPPAAAGARTSARVPTVCGATSMARRAARTPGWTSLPRPARRSRPPRRGLSPTSATTSSTATPSSSTTARGS